MKKVEIENRLIPLEKKNENFLVVDLIIDGEKIETGQEPISSYSFWKDIEDEARRSLYRIKKNNPRLSFNFDFATMGLSEKDKDDRFRAHIKGKYPDLDVDNILDVFKGEVAEIKPEGPDDNHPNPEIKFPIDSHLFQNVLISVISKINK